MSGWMYKRDVPKFSEHIGSIENARFSVLAGLPEEGTGMGRKVKLEEKITLKDAIEKTKAHLKLERIRLVLGINHTMESEVGVVAVCAGSGIQINQTFNIDIAIFKNSIVTRGNMKCPKKHVKDVFLT